MTTVPVKDPQVVKMNITTALSPIRNEFYISISFFIFLNYRTLPWTIEVSRDIPRLPTLDVLLDLQQQLNIFHETRPVQSVYPAIQWIGNGRGKLRWYPYLKFLQWCIFCVKPSNNPIFYQLSPSPATFHFFPPEIFTAADVTLMISLSEYISNVSSKVDLEREMLARSKESGSIPVGKRTISVVKEDPYGQPITTRLILYYVTAIWAFCQAQP